MQNVLIMSIRWNGIHVKLADFGIAKLEIGTTTGTFDIGTRGYIAPEMQGYGTSELRGNDYGKKIDMWGLGCLVHEMLTLQLPFTRRLGKTLGIFSADALGRFCGGDTRLATEILRAENHTVSAVDFIDQLLVFDGDNRMTAVQALSHEWLAVGTAVMVEAAGKGHWPVVEALLRHHGVVDQSDASANAQCIDALLAAAENGHKAVVQNLLERGVGPDTTSGGGPTPLQLAVSGRHMATVDLLLNHCANVNANPRNNSPLEQAVLSRDIELLCLLLWRGADASAPGSTALHTAAEYGDVRTVKLLLKHGADINSFIDGDTPLSLAIQNRHFDVVEVLVGSGADISRSNNYSALDNAIAFESNVETVQLLLKNGADPNEYLVENEGTALSWAAAKSTEVVRVLLEHGAHVNTSRGFSGTALKQAVNCGSIETVKLLLKHGAEVNAGPPADFTPERWNGYFERHISGRTALQIAAEQGEVALVELLLYHGANINAAPWPDPAGPVASMDITKSGRTALQAAAGNGHTLVVNLLLSYGADVNAAPSAWGVTALQAAALGGYSDICSSLLSHGANADAAPSQIGLTALHLAALHGHYKVAQQLIDKVDVNRVSPRTGGTALQMAAASNHIDVVELLLESGKAGVDVAAPNFGPTALESAASGGYINIVRKLLDNGAKTNTPPRQSSLSPLAGAAMGGHFEVIAELLFRDALITDSNTAERCESTLADIRHLERELTAALDLYKSTNQTQISAPGAKLIEDST